MLKILPNEIENIVLEYVQQLIYSEKYNKIVNKINTLDWYIVPDFRGLYTKIAIEKIRNSKIKTHKFLVKYISSDMEYNKKIGRRHIEEHMNKYKIKAKQKREI